MQPLLFSFLLVLLASYFAPVFAQSAEEKNFLLMYFKEEELTVESPTRSPQPVARTAENVTVVTASDIELMNAHTLADVLNTVTGVQVLMDGGPGSAAAGFIQGSAYTHVTVIMDGVVLNNLSDNVADISMVPVQNIEKIEIIKGPASSAWGSSLGGVVNIITKSGRNDNQGGTLAASAGTMRTGDVREEARGKQDKFGYYVTAGALKSDGLTPGYDIAEYNAYAKLSYDVTEDTGIFFTFGYAATSRGDGQDEVNDIYYSKPSNIMFSTLAVNSRLRSNLDLNVSVRMLDQTYATEKSLLRTGTVFEVNEASDKGYGSSAKLTWKDSFQTIVFGGDYDEKSLQSVLISDGEKGIKKWAGYVNDTVSFNKLTVTPGVRYDHTSTNGAITSQSLGIAYNLAADTTFRLYGAKGFNLPPLGVTYLSLSYFDPNPGLKMETIRSYQAGVETAALKYIWMKVSVFWSEIRDAITAEPSPLDPLNKFTYVNEGRQRRRGVDYVVKTASVYNISVSAGAEFIDAEDLDTGLKLNGPIRIYDIGIHYDDLKSFKALLTGRYINWNSPPDWNGTYGSYVYDLHVIKKIYDRKDVSLEAFADAHNLFNRAQYYADFSKNPERWYEGGLRLKF